SKDTRRTRVSSAARPSAEPASSTRRLRSADGPLARDRRSPLACAADRVDADRALPAPPEQPRGSADHPPAVRLWRFARFAAAASAISYTQTVSRGAWELIFMMLVLKIPLVYLGFVVCYAIKAEPVPGDDPHDSAVRRPWRLPDVPVPPRGGPPGT